MRVAVCVDDSNPSKEAVEKAIEFSEESESEIILIHSVTPEVSVNPGEKPIKESSDEAISRGRDIVNNMRANAQERATNDTDINVDVLSSKDNDNVSVINSYLSKNDIDHVFIGHRGMDEKHEELFGSFAKKLISNAPVPVTVVTYNEE